MVYLISAFGYTVYLSLFNECFFIFKNCFLNSSYRKKYRIFHSKKTTSNINNLVPPTIFFVISDATLLVGSVRGEPG